MCIYIFKIIVSATEEKACITGSQPYRRTTEETCTADRRKSMHFLLSAGYRPCSRASRFLAQGKRSYPK
eukprot:5270042-Ditylum_brightwellii.AAC.1